LVQILRIRAAEKQKEGVEGLLAPINRPPLRAFSNGCSAELLSGKDQSKLAHSMRCARFGGGVAVSWLLFFGLACCGFAPSAPAAQKQKLTVLTSFLPVYCFTVNVAGELAEVRNLLPANVEPHDYQFSRKDLQKLSRADLLVVNGLGMEKWLEKAFAVQMHSVKIVQLAAGLDSEIIYARAVRNPHIWLDPRLARRAVTNILVALREADPANASGYVANAANYLARLEKLDRDLQQTLAPVQNAPIVTYHDAFPYFARRYGLRIVGVVEPAPEVNPSLKYLAALYRSIRANQVQAIFTEATAAPRLAKQVGCDLRLPVVQLDTLEAGPLKADGYEEGMKRNARMLVKYLKADATGKTP